MLNNSLLFKLNSVIIQNYKNIEKFSRILRRFQMSTITTTAAESQKFKVYVTQPIPPEALKILQENNFDATINENVPLNRDVFLKSVKNIDALFCTLNEKINAELLDSAGKQLKVSNRFI